MDNKYVVGAVADIISNRKNSKRKSSESIEKSHSAKKKKLKNEEQFQQKTADAATTEVSSNPISVNKNAQNALKRIERKKHNDFKKPVSNSDRDIRTIFVGNLPNTVKKMKLKKWFSKFGDVETVRLRCPPLSDPRIPKKVAVIKREYHPDRTNIHAFVRFVTEDSALQALEANGALFDENHHIRVDMAANERNYNYKKAVFIGNLPFGAEEEQLRNIFKVCGEIDNIRIVRDHKTGVGKGIGYVNFETEDAVQLALKLDGEKLGTRELRVKKASNKMNKTSFTPGSEQKISSNKKALKVKSGSILESNFQGNKSSRPLKIKKKKHQKIKKRNFVDGSNSKKKSIK